MQDPRFQLKGVFIEDTVKIGQEIHYALSLRHDGSKEVFFPNPQHHFGDFEMIRKDYFKTKIMRDQVQLDSAVYVFRIFTNKTVESLSIPIYVMNESDCTRVSPISDQLFIKHLIKNPENIKLDSLYQQIPISPLQAKTDIKTVLSDALIVLFGVALIYWFAGNRIKAAYYLYKLWLKNRDYKRNYQRLVRNINGSNLGLKNLENAITIWKMYLEQMTGLAFSTFTSKEMLDNLDDQRLEKTLNEMDSAIYGGNFSNQTLLGVEVLAEIAHSMYLNEQEHIQEKFKKG